MGDPVPFKRPIPANRLRTDEAERIIRERAKDTAKVLFGVHAFDRIEDRSITQVDAYVILEKGFVSDAPVKNEEGEWECVVTRRLAGHREAGVVTIILREDGLFVKTVMWMD